MEVSFWQWLFTLLFLTCFVSFGWAMQRFFVQPSGNTDGMRAIRSCGLAFGLLHLGLILKSHTPTPVERVLAVTLYLASFALFWWAFRTNRTAPLSAAFSYDLPVHLVQQGPYRLIRHPFYTSYLLAWMAGVPAAGQLWLLLTVVVMAMIYLRAASQEEEKFRQSKLAQDYLSYQARTGRFLPNLAKLFTSFKTS